MQHNWQELIPVLQGILDEATSPDGGSECGCQLAIYEHGNLVVDLVSGLRAPGGAPVTRDDLFPIFSCGKAVAATTIHRLVEKGILSYDQKVADLWPEFACNGKEDIRVWHLLTHRAGLQALPNLHDFADQGNWDLMCAKMAEATPVWAPGGKSAYHGVTFAWLVGETAARAAGKDFRSLVTELVLQPLGLENSFSYGTVTPDMEARFVRLDDSLMPGQTSWCSQFMHCAAIRHGLIPSANAVCTAKALAKHYASLIGEVDGVRLLSPETIANATILRRAADDPIPPEGTWAKFGLGYALTGPDDNLGLRFGHGGAAGAEGFADKERGLAVAFVKNRPLPSHPVHPVRDRLSEALGLPIRHW